MTKVRNVREAERRNVPAVTHVDGTGRLQTVSRKTNPRYHAPIVEFERQTGVSLVLNPSFNEHEPIVASPKDAIACYLRPAWTCSRPGTECSSVTSCQCRASQ